MVIEVFAGICHLIFWYEKKDVCTKNYSFTIETLTSKSSQCKVVLNSFLKKLLCFEFYKLSCHFTVISEKVMAVAPFVLEILFVCLFVSLLHWHYGNWKRQQVSVTIVTLVAWTLPFMIIFILPIDVSVVSCPNPGLRLLFVNLDLNLDLVIFLVLNIIIYKTLFVWRV